MVTIVDCVKRQNSMHEEFIALIVQSELEIVTSKSGNVYVAARKASVPSTLDWDTAKMMIGKELPGTIERVDCEPYQSVNVDGEPVVVDKRYSYIPEESRTVFEEKQVITIEELEAETV